MWLRILLASVLLAETACATMPPCPARGGPAWRQFSSEHFTLRTDLEPHDAEEVVRALEDARAAMLVGFWAGAPGPRERTQVIALASHSELAVFTGLEIEGLFVRAPPFSPTLIIGSASFLLVESARHELAHELSQWFLPIQPPWYSEGIATFLETIRYDRARGRVVVGEPSNQRFNAIKRTGVVSIEHLFGPMPEDVRELVGFEDSSWLLMHYLLNHRADGFLDLQRRLARLEPARNAWRATFPDLDDDQLSRTLDVYVRSARYVVKSIPLAPWRGETEMRPLTDAEVHGLRAYLFAKAHLPNQPTKLVLAHAEIDEALRIDPSVLDALAVAFYAPEVPIDTPHPELARRAVSAHPESWLAWLMVADSTSSRDVPARLTALARALEVAPDQPEVLTRMAALKASSGNWDEALAFSTKALRAGTVRPDLWMIRLAALANTARCAEAALLASAITAYLAPTQARVVTKAWQDLRRACTSRSVLSRPRPDNDTPAGGPGTAG